MTRITILPKTPLLLTPALLALALLALGIACQNKSGGDTKQHPPKTQKQPATPPMETMAAPPIKTMAAVATKPKAPAKGPAKATLDQCKALYLRLLKGTLPHLTKLGFKTTLQELSNHYRLGDAKTYRHCLNLTPTQLACVDKLPNPLASRARCKHKSYLYQEVPKALKKALFPEPPALSPAAAKGQMALLRGTWKSARYGGAEVLKVASDGSATAQTMAQGKPKGAPKKYKLSFPAAYRIQRESKQWATMTGVLFLPDRKTLFWSDNQAYTIQPLKNRRRFRLVLTRGSLLTYNGKTCESLDTLNLWPQKPKCAWRKDHRSKLPIFEVQYAHDDRTNRVTFYYLKGHLLRSGLYHNRWRR